MRHYPALRGSSCRTTRCASWRPRGHRRDHARHPRDRATATTSGRPSASRRTSSRRRGTRSSRASPTACGCGSTGAPAHGPSRAGGVGGPGGRARRRRVRGAPRGGRGGAPRRRSPCARTPPRGRRAEPEATAALRTPFQRDRDRIVHSKAFRRLKHKTQVFVAPEGDHYRTRLTHTLEVVGISRTVARALRLNEDLTEAIGARPRPRPPAVRPRRRGGARPRRCRSASGARFRHNEHSLRVVDVLERDGRGLNLTEEVRDGILNHTGPVAPATLEGRIVKLVDRIAYINHDIDDAIRAGVLTARAAPAGADRAARRDRLAARSTASCTTSSRRRSAPATSCRRRASARRCSRCAASCSRTSTCAAPSAGEQEPGAHRRARRCSTGSATHPEQLPAARPTTTSRRRVVDHVAGMTDRYAIRDYRERFVPDAWRSREAGSRSRSLEAVQRAGGHRRARPRRTPRCSGAAAQRDGRCPFHEERTPSFWVDPAHEALLLLRLRGAGRRVPLRVQSSRGSTSPAAVEQLADRYGVELAVRASRAARARSGAPAARRLERCSTTRGRFYERMLAERPRPRGRARTSRSAASRARRVERFGLGFAPDAWDRVCAGRARQRLLATQRAA